MSTTPPMLLSWCPGKTPPDACDPCACNWVQPTLNNVSGTNPKTFTTGISRTTVGGCHPIFSMVCYQDQSRIGGGLVWMGGTVGPPIGPVGTSVNVSVSYANSRILSFSGLDNATSDQAAVPAIWRPTMYLYQGSFHYSSWTAPVDLISNTLFPGYPAYGFVWDGPIDPVSSPLIITTVAIASSGNTVANPINSAWFNGNPRAPSLPGFRAKSSVVRQR